MSQPAHAAGRARPAQDCGAPRTHGSLPVRMFMGPMTKVLNPLVRAGAGRRHFGMAAQIHHRGRRSGRVYVTPASARVQGDTFWIPLTFGTESDWCRNVRAAGGCRIKWRGIEYTATDPRLVTVDVARREARSAFKGYERLMFRMLRINHFLRLQVHADGPQVAPLTS
jgi:deazaflavin-dependent oxidoreductase (nitroreductase family)